MLWYCRVYNNNLKYLTFKRFWCMDSCINSARHCISPLPFFSYLDFTVLVSNCEIFQYTTYSSPYLWERAHSLFLFPATFILPHSKVIAGFNSMVFSLISGTTAFCRRVVKCYQYAPNYLLECLGFISKLTCSFIISSLAKCYAVLSPSAFSLQDFSTYFLAGSHPPVVSVSE